MNLGEILAGGQERRKKLDQTLGETLNYYLGPTGIPQRLAALGVLNPVNDMEQASQKAKTVFSPDATGRDRFDAGVGMVTDMATVLAPAAAANRVGSDATAAVVDSLLGIGQPTREGLQDAGRRFAADEFGGVGLNSKTFYHGTPDAREVRAAGGFTDQKPVFFSDNRGVAASYADDSRAFDYQNAEPAVFSAKTSPQRVLDIDAGGADFRGLDVGAVRKGLLDAGIPESEIESALSGVIVRSDNKIRTDDVVKVAKTLGFDAADVARVRDSYNNTAKAKPSTVRIMLNQSQVELDGIAKPTKADEIARLLREGRAEEITDDMMAALDPNDQMRLFKLYEDGATGMPMPMDEASRMARARNMGFTDDAYHATSKEFAQFIPSEFRGASFFGPTPEGATKGASASANEGVGSGTGIIIPARVNTSGVRGLGAYDQRNMNEFRKSLPDRIYTEQEVDALMASDAAPGRGDWTYFFDDLTDYDALRTFRDNNPDAPIPDGIIKFRPKASLQYSPDLKLDLTGRQFAHYSEGMSERPSSNYTKEQGNTGFTMQDESGLALAVTDPTTIRSRFARFDPRLKHLANLSAAGAGVVPLGALLANYDQDAEQRKLRDYLQQ